MILEIDTIGKTICIKTCHQLEDINNTLTNLLPDINSYTIIPNTSSFISWPTQFINPTYQTINNNEKTS